MTVSEPRRINPRYWPGNMLRGPSLMLVIALVSLTGKVNAKDLESDASAIGTATLSPDGTLALHLRAEERGEDGELVSVGQAYFEYKPGDPDYKDILKHIGEIEVGQEKYILPWKE